MKIPRSILICGKTYKVKSDRNTWGGSSATGKQQIIVGMKSNQTAERKFDNIVHEVLEAITMEREFRYTGTDNEIRFVMTHKEFDCFASDVSSALLPMIK